MNLKSNRAITLIALIITIIILLILAGVSLSMVLGENGLINKAQSSVNKYQESYVNEQNLLNKVEEYFDKVEDKTYVNGETVSVGGYDFYVIGDDGTNVTLLCKTSIASAGWREAKSQASTFGSNLGGSGRLLTKAEAEGVAASYRNIGILYWLEDFYSDGRAWHVLSNGNFGNNNLGNHGYGVRPVVIISKSKL